MTYDVFAYHGKVDDAAVHTILFKLNNKAIGQRL